MAAKPLSTEAIALTEKKMDMTLDDIIRMSKNTSKTKRERRVPNKGQKFSNGLTQDKSSKLRRFMESRSSVRQGVLAKRRSNFQENQFPVAAEIAQKAAVAPLRNRASNRSRMANRNKARKMNGFFLHYRIRKSFLWPRIRRSVFGAYLYEVKVCGTQSSKSTGNTSGFHKYVGDAAALSIRD